MASARLVPDKKPDVELTLTHGEALSLLRVAARTAPGFGPVGADFGAIYRALSRAMNVGPVSSPWEGDVPTFGRE